MATQVELGAALASLTNIGELRSETTLQRAFVGPFSDPGAKNGDRADEGAKFANPLRPSTMPPAASKPRLTPRPFSREKSCETFAAVKPPVAAAKPEETTAKVSTGNVPPLLDQKLIENKTSKELVTDIPFYPTPSANTVILFETASHENGKLRVNPDKAFAVSGVQQEPLSSPKSENSYSKPEAVYRPAESRTPPRKSLERKDTFSGSDGVGKYPTDAESRPKPRPVSAIFLESLKDQKPSGVDLPDETKPVPEKPWGRKPRPLSMDLTAKFENLSAQKRSRPPESKETPGLSAADSSKPDPTVAGDESKAATPIRKSAPDESTSRVSARKNPWERGSAVAEISDKKEVPPSKERTVLNRDESRFGIENATDPPDVGNKASKGVKKMADIADSSANAESLPETRVMNIQQRIKELTGDNADLKPGNFRRSFRTRPLPSDLTKLFSVSPTGAETRPEKQTEATRRAPNDTQEKKRTPQCGGEETRETGNPWKPQQIAKTTFADERPDKDGRSVKERQSTSVPQGNGPASTTIRNVKSPENAAVKTVRATMFEHNVERHTVMANHFATEPTKPQPTSDPTTGQSGHFRASWVEKVLDAKVTSRKVSDAATDAEKARKTRPVSEDKTPWEKRVSKERCDKTPPKPVEDSLVYQRIEPRYEILQTIGERVQSEAIATAPEDKAVTLRSRRSLKERRRTDGVVVADAAWARSLDVRDWKEEIPVPKGKDPGESAIKATPTRDIKGSSHERVTEVNRSWSGQHAATARPSYFGNRNADWERTEEKVSKPSAGTDKGRRDATLVGKTKEGSGTAKKFPEDFGGEPSRIEVCESSASVTGERESETNSRRTTQRPPKTSGQDESTVSDRGAKGGDEFRETDADEGVGKRGRGASPPKPVERWRRKTLPHDAFRTEEARERGKSPSRRDSFQFWDGSVAKRSDKPGPESGPKNELSPSDSKATYFALTYQIPDGNENAPRKASDPIKTQHVSPLAGDASVPPSAGVAKTSSPGNRFSDKQGSLDRDPGRNGGDGDSSEIPQRGLLKYPLTAAKNESQNWDKESAGEVGFPIHGSGAKSPSRLSSGQKKSNDPNYRGVSKDKSADGYRSRVLDLDALMAEYKEDAKKASLIQGNLPEESNAFSREKMSHQRHAADKTPCGYAQKKSDVSPGIAGEKETLESVNRETLKTGDGKRSPPRWGRQAAEKPADRAGAWKKTFIVDEEEGADLVRRHQTAKQMDYGAEFGSPVGADVDLVARPSRLIESARWKGTRLKRETTVRKEVDTRADTNMSLFGKCNASAAKNGQEPRAVGTGFANAPPDLRRSYSEKVRQSRARGAGFPFGEKVEDRRSVPLETVEDSLEKWSASPHGVLLSDGKKPEVEKDGTKSDREGPLTKNSPYSLLQRRSRSFYRERRTDHWATDQLKQCFGRPAGDAKDTDTLVQETENQYGTWQDQPQSADIFVLESPSSESVSAPARKPTSGSSRLSSFSSSHTDPTSAAEPPDASRDRRGASPDRDSTDAESAELAAPSGTSPDFSFLDQTPVLDSSALKTRVQLSKRRRQRRTPISNSLRRSGGVEEGQPRTSERGETDSAWMFKDSSTGEKPSRRGESDEEGGPRPPERSPAPQTQRLPVFPGMDHSAFKAQLRKRHEPEGTAGTGSRVSAQSRSPKSPFHAGGVGVLPGSRMLPTGTETEERRSEEVSPQWLKELKSKKRQSQYENQV